MGEIVYLEEYKEKLMLEEIAALRSELQAIMSTWPDHSGGYFLSLEEMEKIEKAWLEEKRNQ